MRLTHASHRSFYYYLGLFAFGILCLFSILFWKERILFLDNAFQSFLLLKEESIEIMVYRWPAALMRVLPWIAIKSGIGLPYVLISFSFSYALFQMAIFILLYKGLRSPFFALLHLMICTIPILDSFYWCSSEYIQGLSFLLIFFAFGVRKRFQFDLRSGFILGFLGLCLLFYHPLIILPFTLVCIYFMLIEQSNWKWRLGAIWLIFISFYIVKSFLFKNWYDDGKQAEFFQHLNNYITHPWTIPAHKLWVSELLGRHILWSALFVFTSVGIVYAKKYLPLLYMLFSIIIYLIIVHIADPIARFRFYTEVNYIVLVLLVGLPFLTYLLNPFKESWIIKLFMLCILLLSLLRIGIRHTEFRERNDWIISQLMTSDHSKIYKLEQNVPMGLLKMTWATPYESLLSTHLNKQEIKTLTVHPNTELIDENPDNRDLLLTSFKAIHIDSLPPEFRKLKGIPYVLEEK